MFDHPFIRTRLGLAALFSVAAMISFNMLVLSHQLQAQPLPMALSAQMVELA